jgi:hypothetical protein
MSNSYLQQSAGSAAYFINPNAADLTNRISPWYD